MAYLERNEYEEIEPEDLEEAREILLEEVLYGWQFLFRPFFTFILVKQEMDHGEITNEAFDQVWNECFNEVNSFLCNYSDIFWKAET